MQPAADTRELARASHCRARSNSNASSSKRFCRSFTRSGSPTMQEGQETRIRSHIRSSTLHQEKPRIHRTCETRWSSRDSLPYAQKERTKPHAFRLILPSRPRLLQNDSFSARSIQFPLRIVFQNRAYSEKRNKNCPPAFGRLEKKAPHHMMQRLEALDGCRPNEFRESSRWLEGFVLNRESTSVEVSRESAVLTGGFRPIRPDSGGSAFTRLRRTA